MGAYITLRRPPSRITKNESRIFESVSTGARRDEADSRIPFLTQTVAYTENIYSKYSSWNFLVPPLEMGMTAPPISMVPVLMARMAFLLTR